MNIALAIIGLLLVGTTPTGDTLSDDELLRYASKPYDKSEMMDRLVDLGIYHGARVVVEFPCSDLCPAETVRIIHYDLGTDQTCSAVKGSKRTIQVPLGVGTHKEEFCFPKPLADHWDEYIR